MASGNSFPLIKQIHHVKSMFRAMVPQALGGPKNARSMRASAHTIERRLVSPISLTRQTHLDSSSFTKVRPSEIEYFKIRVHNPYHEDLIELNPMMSFFFKLEDV